MTEKLKTPGEETFSKSGSTPPENRILSCDTKDESGLNDFHKQPDIYGLDVDKVGINRFRIPLLYRHRDGTVINHDTEASMYISFPRGKAGINMSRLYEILQDESEGIVVGPGFFRKVLGRYRSDMRDQKTDPLYPESFVKLRFNYAVRQKALKSDNYGWQYYQSVWDARENAAGEVRLFLTVCYEYSSTCPCSLSMSKQYEAEHARNKVDDGNGMATPHSQRSQARCTIEINPDDEFFIDDLIDLLREAIPTETQSFVKRVDEQAFAVLNAQHPMFVEHATRRLALVLNREPRILDWVVSVEHWESLHSHNAVAVIRKGITGGLT
jgi:GTP cyclohydrolase I